MEDDDEALGSPIGELAQFREPPSPGFVHRLLDSLRRRDLSSQLATLGWTGLGSVFVEYIKLIFSVFDANTDSRGGSE
jgi:hypothetical protein